MTRATVELLPDVVIAGKLRLVRPLGQGGMGVVWTARHLSLQTEVAVKFIRPERVAADPTLVTRFEREARTAARIAHPHVVQVMDYGATDGIPYMVMELLQGASLARLLERGGRLSFATAKSLVRQVGGALEAAHELGVVHRDIKPPNLFITEGSKGYPLFLKVLDFGVAKMLGDGAVPDPTGALTETGMLIGSPPYMSPEQLEGSKDVDLRSDLWSLGVILYECLTGRRPFDGSSYVGVGAAVLRGEYRPASELRPGLPPTIDDWFARALCLEPEGRFSSARELVDSFVGQRLAVAEADDEDRSFDDGDELPEFATTLPAARAVDRPDTGAAPLEPTVDHEPPAPRPAARGRRRTRRRRAQLALVAGVAIVLGVGVAQSVRPPPATSCPEGMVLVEGGHFQMGSAEGADTPTDETPRHEASVEAFCLDRTEVTVGEYGSCDGCPPAPQTVKFEGLTPNGRAFLSQFCNGPDRPGHPVNCIDFFQAEAYCAARGKRLPTEQEWELAARGAEGRLYPWGDEPPAADRVNACGAECSRMLTERMEQIGKGPWPAMHAADDGAAATAPVGSFPAGATPAGVLDLAGNVWEWTASAYCAFGSPDCGDSRRVLRGGGWDTVEGTDVRAARRYPSAPSARARSVGFRCAKTL